MSFSYLYLLQRRFAVVRFAGLLLAIPLLLGADDSYLREIEDEVKRQAATLIVDQPSSTPTTATDGATERLAPGLSQAAFEQALRKSLPGTYTLYERLKAPGKQQVYESYRNDNRLANISENVTRLLGGKP